MQHAAVLHTDFLDLILAGIKTVESRLSLNRVPPFGVVSPRDHVLFKVPGGRFVARATVDDVIFHQGLTPRRVRALEREWNHRVCAPRDYWAAKSLARYATMIVLADPCPLDPALPAPRFHGSGWVLLAPRTRARIAG